MKKIVWLIALLFASIAPAQQLAPRWMYELPAEPDGYVAIGECGNYFNLKQAAIEVRRVAAFRLAARIKADIRYGLAAELNGASGRHISFAEVSVDTALMKRLVSEMIVLDSVHLDDGFHLLVSRGIGGDLPDRFKELLKPAAVVPDWVKKTPDHEGFIHGVGSSWKRGLDGWEEAERMARVAIAEQISLDVKTGTWSFQAGSQGSEQVVTNQVINMTLHNTQVIARGRDKDGVSYVLVRMPQSEIIDRRNGSK